MRLGLSRMETLLAGLKHPEKQIPFIHVAGTNGKGSVCAMTAAVLQAAGYRVGVYTSPYINFFEERIQVNGVPISKEELEQATRQVRQVAEPMEDPPTEFELVTAIGFLHFLQAGCDIVVLEVGLGGALDATNCIPTPLMAVITAIGLDHTQQLGDTVEQIAAQKGGIIKQEGHVVLMSQAPAVEGVIKEICRERQAQLFITKPESLESIEDTLEGQRFNYAGWTDVKIRLLGPHQLDNAMVVLEIIEGLRRLGWKLETDLVLKGFLVARWPARFELLSHDPLFILDGGHNPHSVEALAKSLNRYCAGKKIHFLIGVLEDKDYPNMLKWIVPMAKSIVTLTPDNPRALKGEQLASWIQKSGFYAVTACNSVEQGIQLLLKNAGKEEVICGFGSLYMAGAIRKYFAACHENNSTVGL